MRKLRYIIGTLFATLLLFTCVEEFENKAIEKTKPTTQRKQALGLMKASLEN